MVAVVLAHIAVPMLKEIVERPRPADPIISVDGYSWPSGHAAYGMIYAWIAFLMAVSANVDRVSGTVRWSDRAWSCPRRLGSRASTCAFTTSPT